jgi:ketosteroid isomerase-like protein
MQQLGMELKPKEAEKKLVTDDMKARIYGDAAVVTGRSTIKGTLKGTNISGQERSTDTWIKREGRWICAASHSSAIAQK